jgi:zinc transport system ATP-binding protein
MPIIKVSNLSVKYGNTEALQDLSFSIEKGDYVALAGPNGAGKTTLAKAILGLAPVSSGNIEIFGEDRKKFKAWQRLGYLPQKLHSFNPLFPATVSEVVDMGLLAGKKLPRRLNAKDKQKRETAMKLLDISDLADKPLRSLSGGQQQRAFLARALASEPELLILDEPGSALDPQSRDSFFKLIQHLNKEHQVTIIMVTHDVGHAGEFANKLLYVDKKLVFYGRFDDFCGSGKMGDYFGEFAQHLICHQHR